MDIKIENGDFETDYSGHIKCINGVEETLQRIRNCLKIPKGSFLPSPCIGNDFYKLTDFSDESVKHACIRALSAIKDAAVKTAHAEKKQDELHIFLRIEIKDKGEYEVNI